MILQYCSDLHLEFPENRKFLKASPLLVKGDILLLAGDVFPFAAMENHGEFFDFVADNFRFTYWLPGNHEYYYSDATKRTGTLYEKIRSNVFLVNNTSVQHEHAKLIFSTLWTKICPAYEWQIEQGMSDFQVIRYNGYRFSSVQYNQLHKDSINFLEQEVRQHNAGKAIIITHHVPTLLNYPEEYKNSVLNEAFAVELQGFIENAPIDYWIYGHHHTNTPDFVIGNTKMLTNQLGYVRHREHQFFNRSKIINLHEY